MTQAQSDQSNKTSADRLSRLHIAVAPGSTIRAMHNQDLNRRGLLQALGGAAIGGLLGIGGSAGSVALGKSVTQPGTPGPDRVFDVHAYGARGDGVHDDAPAVQAAVEAAREAQGGTVCLAAGRYLIGTAIHLKSGVALHGDGSSVTTIVAKPGGNWKAQAPSTWHYIVGEVNQAGVTVEHVEVDAGGQNASGIAFLGGDGHLMQHNYVHNSTGHSGCHFFGGQAPGVTEVTNSRMLFNHVDGFPWNIVMDGDQDSCIMLGNMSTNPSHRHISLDGAGGKATGRGSQKVYVAGNIGHGKPTKADQHGLYAAQWSGVITGNCITEWNVASMPIAEIGYCDGEFTANHLAGDPRDTPSCGIYLINTRTGLLVANNVVSNASVGMHIDNRYAGVVGSILGNDFTNCPTPIQHGALGPTLYSGYHIVDNHAYRGNVDPLLVKGTCTVRAGSIDGAFHHGLPVTPAAHDLQVVPMSSLYGANNWWASVDATSVTLTLDRAPTADVGFAVVVDAR